MNNLTHEHYVGLLMEEVVGGQKCSVSTVNRSRYAEEYYAHTTNDIHERK